VPKEFLDFMLRCGKSVGLSKTHPAACSIVSRRKNTRARQLIALLTNVV
jgi:hypothetical protein